MAPKTLDESSIHSILSLDQSLHSILEQHQQNQKPQRSFRDITAPAIPNNCFQLFPQGHDNDDAMIAVRIPTNTNAMIQPVPSSKVSTTPTNAFQPNVTVAVDEDDVKDEDYVKPCESYWYMPSSYDDKKKKDVKDYLSASYIESMLLLDAEYRQGDIESSGITVPTDVSPSDYWDWSWEELGQEQVQQQEQSQGQSYEAAPVHNVVEREEITSHHLYTHQRKLIIQHKRMEMETEEPHPQQSQHKEIDESCDYFYMPSYNLQKALNTYRQLNLDNYWYW